MSEVSRAAAPAPKPAAPANRTHNGGAGEQRSDAFSALLSLAADTSAAPSADAGAESRPDEAHAAAKPADDEDRDAPPEGDDNPVAQLLGWADPRPVDRASTATAPASTAAAPASDASGQEQPTGVDISGMEALATPEAIDPAALPPGALAARNALAKATDARDARVIGARRDAKAVAASEPAALRASASATPAQPGAGRAAPLGGAANTVRGRGAAWTASTVSMDLSAARAADGVAGNAVSLTARLSELLSGRAQADGAAPTPLLGATQEAGSAACDAPSPADLLPSPDAAADADPAQFSHWSSQQLRHAHLRLGEGGLDSLDIRLSMQGQDLSVDFRSDNADIRQSLAQQANQSLASLLERSGIALADVSVGAQQRQPGDPGAGDNPGQRPGSTQSGRGQGGAEAAAPAVRPLAQPALRADGSRPLDLFV